MRWALAGLVLTISSTLSPTISSVARAEPPAAAADEPPPPPREPPLPAGWRLMLSDLSIFRMNPLGLETRARLGLQKQLYASDHPVTRTNFGFVGVFPKLNPASAQLGIGGELQPASILNVRAFYELQQYFGTFGFLQSFSSANATYSDHALDALRDDPQRPPQAALIRHASLQPLLQLKVGPIAMRGLFQLDYWDFDVRAGETLVYEPTFDTLLPRKGWTLAVDSDLLYVGHPGLAIGLRHSLVRPFYTAEHFTDAADQAAYGGENTHHRLGLFAAYTLRDRGPSRFNKPTIVLIVSWYLQHRWRTGAPTMPPATTPEDHTSRAVPYVVVGFAFESDLLAVE